MRQYKSWGNLLKVVQVILQAMNRVVAQTAIFGHRNIMRTIKYQTQKTMRIILKQLGSRHRTLLLMNTQSQQQQLLNIVCILCAYKWRAVLFKMLGICLGSALSPETIYSDLIMVASYPKTYCNAVWFQKVGPFTGDGFWLTAAICRSSTKITGKFGWRGKMHFRIWRALPQGNINANGCKPDLTEVWQVLTMLP